MKRNCLDDLTIREVEALVLCGFYEAVVIEDGHTYEDEKADEPLH